jgi:two-component system sensor kinase FixL
MPIPTQDPRNIAAGIVSAVAWLTSAWRTREIARNALPSSRPRGINLPPYLHDKTPRDASGGFLRKRLASVQETIHRKQPGVRAYRGSSAAHPHRMRQLNSALSGYLRWSARRTEEATLLPAAEGLKPLLDMVPAAVIVLDETHTVVLFNELAATLFGYPAEEPGALSLVQLFPYIGDGTQSRAGVSALCAPDDDFAESGERQAAIARCHDGSERAVSVKRMQYGSAGASLWIITGEDLCDQQDACRGDPQHGHLARVFELAEMAAVLAHEINQPLTAILSNAQAVQRFPELARCASTDLRDALADIVANSFRATEIVRKLRQFVRRAAPEALLLDIGNLVRGVIHLMRRDAVVRGVSVTLDIAEPMPKVRGDIIQLQQVMINLLQNAFDAVEGCCAEDRVVSVSVSAAPQGEGLSITVSDRGLGLKADQIGEVFTPFSTSKPHGLGLGLSISISIISMHGGRLLAESHGDKGATFRILLPVAGENGGSSSRRTS